jgi:hypothetical protein
MVAALDFVVVGAAVGVCAAASPKDNDIMPSSTMMRTLSFGRLMRFLFRSSIDFSFIGKLQRGARRCEQP